MVKQYITTLKNGAREQKAHILGRNITLRDGEVVSEGILTKTFPSLFEEIVDVSIHTEVKKAVVEAETEAPVEETEAETMLTEDSSDVQGVVAEAEAEAPAKKSSSTKATKATKAK